MTQRSLRPRRRWQKKRGRSSREFRRQWIDEPEDRFEPFDAEREMPGTVYSVPDKLWGFEAVGRIDHPGVCTACNVRTQQASLLKGTDAVNVRWQNPASFFIVEPTSTNGLRKTTAFDLVPLPPFRLRRIMLLHRDRRMGKLDPPHFDRLKRELDRVFKGKR